jgi:AAA family ATP:ADP antiporter
MTRKDRTMARMNRFLYKALHLVADVYVGEAAGALLLAADLFCLMASYYVLKTLRESLILSEGGAEVKSYAAGAQALILLAVVPLYGLVASKVNRSRLINGVMLFFVSHLLLFDVLSTHGVHIGVAFFLWVGIFNLMIVAQFWSFANDLYAVDRGERLFPLVGVGGSIGALIGARTAAGLMAAHLEPASLLMIAAIGLVTCVGLNQCVQWRAARQDASEARAAGRQPLDMTSGFRLIAHDRYLQLLAFLVVLVNMVNTVGEYLLGRLVVANASHIIAAGGAKGLTKGQLIGIFYGDFFAWVNALSLFLQLFVVSRVFKRVGAAGALFVLPLIAAGSYGLLAFAPIIAAVRVGKIFENSADYSLQNTARHALYLPTSREAKFKAKQVIDAFCWRAGDVLQAVVVYAGTRLAFGIREFALLNEVFVVVWLGVAIAMHRKHSELVDRQSQHATVPVPARSAALLGSPVTAQPAIPAA